MPKPKCKLNIRFPVIRKEICGFKFRLRFRFLITPLPLLLRATLCMPGVALSGWVGFRSGVGSKGRRCHGPDRGSCSGELLEISDPL